MRTVIAVALSLSLVGCGLELLATTAIRGEMEAESLKTYKRAMDTAEGTKSSSELEHTIAAYYAEKGSYPPSLDALVPEWMPSIPTKPDGTPYGYDPATGQLLDRPLPPPRQVTESDAQRMARIREAINKYGMATGYYPESLAGLVPQYLSEVPKTADGQDFLYDMRDGGLYHPNPQAMAQAAPPGPAPNQAAPQRRAAGAAGGGPLGEVMTGVAIQQDLNSMSSAGANAAGTRLRQGARNAGQNRDQQVNQNMQDLGL